MSTRKRTTRTSEFILPPGAKAMFQDKVIVCTTCASNNEVQCTCEELEFPTLSLMGRLILKGHSITPEELALMAPQDIERLGLGIMDQIRLRAIIPPSPVIPIHEFTTVDTNMEEQEAAPEGAPPTGAPSSSFSPIHSSDLSTPEAPLPSWLPSSSSSSSSPSTASRVPTKLPKFDPAKTKLTATEYIKKLELVFRAENFDQGRWIYGLALSLRGTAEKWAARTLDQHSLSWQQVREEFIAYYTHADEEMETRAKLMSIMQEPNESIRDYAERFINLSSQLNKKNSSKSALFLFKRGLKPHIQTHYTTAERVIAPTTIAKAIEIAKDIELSSSSKPKHGQNPNAGSAIAKGDHRKKGCPRHPYLKPGSPSFHSESDCRKLKEEKASLPPTTEEKRTNPNPKNYPKGHCFNCGRKGHMADKCPDPANFCLEVMDELRFLERTINQAENYFAELFPLYDNSTHDEEKDSHEGTTAHDYDTHYQAIISRVSRDISTITTSGTNHYNNMMEGEVREPPILIPMEIEGNRCMGYIDSGCSDAFIDKSFVDRINISYQAQENTIHLGKKGLTTTSYGITKPIKVKSGNFEVKYRFIIMDLPHEVFVGRPLMKLIGIYVGGLPTSHPSASTDRQVIDDTPPGIMDQSHPHEAQERIKASIKEDLLLNSQVEGFCPLPESIVKLNIDDEAPLYIRQYRIAQCFHNAVQQTIDRWLTKGVIKIAKPGRYNLPLTVSMKKNPLTGKYDRTDNIRVNYDARAINRKLPSYGYQIPLISDIFEALAGNEVYSSIDLKDAFCTFMIQEEDQKFLAFTWNQISYHWCGAPFGLKILSHQFQRVMGILFAECTPFVKIFIDDIAIHSRSVEEHLIHLKKVIDTLTQNNFKVNQEKSHFGFTSLYLLGHHLNKEGIQIDHRKLTGMNDWPTPNGKNIEHYIGFFNYFRSFIPKYSQVMAPLESIRKNFKWETPQEESWTMIKQLVATAPMLRRPDFDKQFYMATDASGTGISAVLLQKDTDDADPTNMSNNNYFISFQARALQPAERRYSTTKKEALGIVYGLTKFRQYIFGRKVIILTDHRALVWIFKEGDNLSLTWLDTILDQEMEVIHLPGTQNVLPDHLSRIFTGVELWGGRAALTNASMDVNTTVHHTYEEDFKLIKELFARHPPVMIPNRQLTKHLNQRYHHDTFPRGKKPEEQLKKDWSEKNYAIPPTHLIWKTIHKAMEQAESFQATTILILPQMEDSRWYLTFHETFPQIIIEYHTHFFSSKETFKPMMMVVDNQGVQKFKTSPWNASTLTFDENLLEVIEDKEKQLELLELNHLLGHFGSSALVKSINQAGYTWKSIWRDSIK